MDHPIGRLALDKRRLFTHEAMAAASVLRAALNTEVVCQPAKLLALYMLIAEQSPEGMEMTDIFNEAQSLFDTLDATGGFDEPDTAMLRVILASMRANPRTDAMDLAVPLDGLTDNDVITL